MRTLRPKMQVPELAFPLVDNDIFDIHSIQIDRFLLVDVYRGLHCPRCHRHLLDLNSKIAHLERRGVQAVAVSMDPQDRCRDAKTSWGLANLKMGYGLSLDDAARWNLFVSDSISEKEVNAYFSEPATFLIAPDRTLYSAIYNTAPFNRFSFSDMLEALDMIEARSYPARGNIDPSEVLAQTRP